MSYAIDCSWMSKTPTCWYCEVHDVVDQGEACAWTVVVVTTLLQQYPAASTPKPVCHLCLLTRPWGASWKNTMVAVMNSSTASTPCLPSNRFPSFVQDSSHISSHLVDSESINQYRNNFLLSIVSRIPVRSPVGLINHIQILIEDFRPTSSQWVTKACPEVKRRWRRRHSKPTRKKPRQKELLSKLQTTQHWEFTIGENL